MAIITVEKLHKDYDIVRKEPGLLASLLGIFAPQKDTKKAVADVSFTVEEGEFVGLLGPNGAGKTTIMKMLAGVLHPSEGNLSVLGFTPKERHPDYLRQIALIMGQKQYLFWDIPPYDTYALLKEIFTIPDAVYRERLAELVDLLDLKDIATIQARRLSLGERMRAELAGALLHSPRVLFLDEPTIGLDVVGQKRIWEFLKKYQQEKKLTIILTSHYMADIEALCERVLVLGQGQLMYDGPLVRLRQRYAPSKRLVVTFEQPVDSDRLQKFGEILLAENSTVTLSIARTDAPKITGEILRRFPVRDVLITEPEAADVIRVMFEQQEQ